MYDVTCTQIIVSISCKIYETEELQVFTVVVLSMNSNE